MLERVQTRLQGWQNLFEDPNQADLFPTEFPGQKAPQLGYADEEGR